MADSMENIRPEIKALFADFLFLQGGVELIERLQGVVTNPKALSALEDLQAI